MSRSEGGRARGAVAGAGAVVGAAVLVAAAGTGGWFAAGSRAGDLATGSPVVATGTAEVARTDVAQRRQVSGTLGYAGDYTIVAAAAGTLTRLPAVGALISRGAVAYEADGEPVRLLYGSRPAWREIALGVPDGTDVRQLEANLVKLGYGAGLTVDRHFSVATAWAVRRWQGSAHLPVTGTVPLGQVVFTPGAVRVGGYDVTVGARVVPGLAVLHGTGSRRAVLAQVDPVELPHLRVGQRVVVTTVDGDTHRGRVTEVGSTAVQPQTGMDGGQGGQGGQQNDQPPMVQVTIVLTGAARGFLDQAPVEVAVTQQMHRGVLAVPIVALHALPGARYEVVVVNAGGRRRVPVETGLFDETNGVAEVSGAGLAEGDHVEVPRDGA
jgi:peptidoglycan hydrolase-like protein with peptidoglycan-binding domain